MTKRLTAGLAAALVLALAAFTGSAFAGGNGGGSDHGNSGNAPGHQDSATPSQPAAQPQQPSAQESKQSPTSASQPATGGDNSHGVKPSSSTKHDTYAKASSDKTKQYGNGKTAGQIATQAGYGDATLHGPGNSQPHKTMCAGHEVDVHALKHKGSKCGSTEQASAPKVAEVKAATHEEQHAAKHEEHHAAQPAHASSEVAQAHVTICHATGSSSNPYVTISPSVSGVFHGHLGHQDGRDIVPPFTFDGHTYSENWDAAGQAAYNAGCTVPAAAQPVTPAAAAPSAPAAASTAGTAQVAGAVASAPAAAPAPAAATVAPATAATAATVKVAPAVATPVSAGGVKGAIIALHPTKTKPAGGVLGATTRLGGTVASARLPFTGLPLWIFTLAAAALIGLGVALRRTSADRI